MPGHQATPCFLATEVGVRAWRRIYWGRSCRAANAGYDGYHDALVLIGDTMTVEDWAAGGKPSDYPDPAAWPTKCDRCGEAVPAGYHLNEGGRWEQPGSPPQYQVFRTRLYEARGALYIQPGHAIPGGLPPGAMFAASWHHDEGRCVWPGWSNCTGPHLLVVLPTGDTWDIDGRASNCTLPNDKTHRCWVRHGEPPRVTVDKAGHTCGAGAGSIAVPGYHGFLRDGVLTAG